MAGKQYTVRVSPWLSIPLSIVMLLVSFLTLVDFPARSVLDAPVFTTFRDPRVRRPPPTPGQRKQTLTSQWLTVSSTYSTASKAPSSAMVLRWGQGCHISAVVRCHSIAAQRFHSETLAVCSSDKWLSCSVSRSSSPGQGSKAGPILS